MSGKILFLDDSPSRARYFTQEHPASRWVVTAPECIQALRESDWDEVHLDHDLGANQLPGMEVVRRVVEERPEHLSATEFIVHSYNIEAAFVMVERLRSAGYQCIYRPFPPTHSEVWASLEERPTAPR